MVALAVAQANACQYCLCAHTAIGKGVGLTPAAIRDALNVLTNCTNHIAGTEVDFPAANVAL